MAVEYVVVQLWQPDGEQDLDRRLVIRESAGRMVFEVTWSPTTAPRARAECAFQAQFRDVERAWEAVKRP